ALHRTDLSRPARCALRDGLILPSATVFDYGCGHGADVTLLRSQGFVCDGWDPVFAPDQPVHEADVVQLGYVINVIEDPRERTAPPRRAGQLCRRRRVVAAQVRVDGQGQSQVAFGDGVLTGLGTFQKYFSQSELKSSLEDSLDTEAIPAEPGIFYVF